MKIQRSEDGCEIQINDRGGGTEGLLLILAPAGGPGEILLGDSLRNESLPVGADQLLLTSTTYFRSNIADHDLTKLSHGGPDANLSPRRRG